jgi:hypothetical protein
LLLVLFECIFTKKLPIEKSFPFKTYNIILFLS